MWDGGVATGAERCRGGRLVALMMTTALATATAGPIAWAQDEQAEAAAAAQTERRRFDIPAQPLTEALIQFGHQSGLQASADAGLVRTLRSAPVQGVMTWREALSQLLAGTGLIYRLSGSMVTVSRPGGADASTGGGDGRLTLGPVRVSAADRTARADAPFTTPGSSAYISREQIERIQPSSPGDIFKEVPGVLSGASHDGTSINVNIRSAQGLNRVRTMVEGTQQESSGYQGYAGADQRTYIDPELIGGVEITKGPGGGPYSTGTTAGAVNIRLLQADDLIRQGRDFGIRVRGGLGGNAIAPTDNRNLFTRNPDEIELADSSNDFLTEDNWFGSLAAAYRSDRFELVGAYARRKEGNYFAGENGPETFIAIRQRSQGPEPDEFRFSPLEPGQEVPNTSENTESLLIKGTLNWQDGQSLEAGYTRYESEFGQVFPTNITLWPPQQFDLNDVDSNRLWLRYKWESENDLINLQANLWHTNAQEQGEVRQGPQENDAWGAEVWNASFLDTPLGELTLTYGGEYATSEAVIDGETLLSGTLYVPGQGASNIQEPLSPAFDGKREVFGGYINAVLAPSDWLIVNAGVRYDGFNASSISAGFECDVDFSETDAIFDRYVEALNRAFMAETFEEFERLYAEALLIEAELNEANLRLDGFCGNTPIESSNKGDRVSPRFGITIEPLEGLQLFAQYSQGFRALSLVELGQTFNGPVTVNPDLEPEVVKSWEVGVNVLRDGLFFQDDAFRAKLVYFNNDYNNFVTRTGTLDSRRGGSVFFYENVPDVTISGFEASLSYDARRVFADVTLNVFDEPLDVPTQASIDQPEYAGTATLGTRWFDETLVLGARLNFFGEPNVDGPLQVSDAGYYWAANEIVDLFGSYRINNNFALGFSVENVGDRYYTAPLYVSRIPAPGRTVRVNTTITF